jgi:hypothetical protein
VDTKEILEHEAELRCKEYLLAVRDTEELLGQFVSTGMVVSGKPRRQPRRFFDQVAIRELGEADKRLNAVRQEWQDTLRRLYYAYHSD